MAEPKGAKARYKTTNRTAYNAALKALGLPVFWMDKSMQWYAIPIGKRGCQQVFSDAAIQFCRSLKCLFGLALRQSQGLVESLLRLAGLDWRVPDISVTDAPMLPELLHQIPLGEPIDRATHLESVERLPPQAADGTYL